jgi:hypothetical protein
VYADFQIESQHLSFAGAELVYPELDELHHAAPEEIAAIYEEAARIMVLAPNAYAVQIRRCLEGICEDRGAKGGSLHEMLRHLASQGDIPPGLAEMTDVLRIVGNIGAHYSRANVTQPDAWAIRDFFLAVVEYVYVGPSKVKEFRDRLAQIKRPPPPLAT